MSSQRSSGLYLITNRTSSPLSAIIRTAQHATNFTGVSYRETPCVTKLGGVSQTRPDAGRCYVFTQTENESQDSSSNGILLKPVYRGDRSRGPVNCSDSIETIDLSGSSMAVYISWYGVQQEQYNERSHYPR
jgi:hypothetical protein